MMNVFFHEMKSVRKMTLSWSLALCAWVVFLLSLYPNFSRHVAEIQTVLGSYPEAIQNIIGLSKNSFSSFLSYYSFTFQGVEELAAVQAMILGATIIFKEVRKKTADFLFSKPISRTRIMTSKLLAGCVSLIITNAIYTVVASIAASLASSQPINMKLFLLISMTMMLIQMIFLSIGILIAVIFPRMKSAVALSIGILFLNMIVYDTFKPIMGAFAVRFLIPFEYFNLQSLIQNAPLEAPFLITTVLIIAATLILSYFLYQKKDVHAA